MLRSLVAVSVLLACGAVSAGSYSTVSYDEPTLVLTEKHLKVQENKNIKITEDKANRSDGGDSLGGWLSAMGELENQYHADLDKLIASTPKRGTSYAKITDSSGNTVEYSGRKAVASRSSNRNTFDIMIESIADKHGVDRGLVKAIMHTESSFNQFARSPVGAQGLMQLMPATARRFNVSNSYDPQQNIEGGVKYLKWLMARFNGNVSYVLAAYNAGEGNVDKYKGIPPFRETQDYVRKVLERYHGLYKHI